MCGRGITGEYVIKGLPLQKVELEWNWDVYLLPKQFQSKKPSRIWMRLLRNFVVEMKAVDQSFQGDTGDNSL